MNAKVSLHQKMFGHIAIIGGGIGGCAAAIELAIRGYSIVLVERNLRLLEASSNITPGRMGLGFHYVHVETALAYLVATIDFVKRCKQAVPLLRVGDDCLENEYLKQGRYFITKNSLFPPERIEETYRAINQKYRELCEADPSNKVFGEPDNFYRKLQPKEYEDLVNIDEVVCGYQTNEQLLNWPVFKEYLISQISQNPKIKILSACEITDFDYDPTANFHILRGKYGDSLRGRPINIEIQAINVINATWEHVQELTNRAAVNTLSSKNERVIEQRTNRLKVIAEVKLPEKLVQAHSMFFCMGPFCMFSNMGNGRGFLTYAPKTNFKNDEQIEVPYEIKKYLMASQNREETKDIIELSKKIKKGALGKQIIQGVAKYIPDMIDAELVGQRYGVVVTYGDADIFDPNSRIHTRNYYGVNYLDYPVGWLNNECMKLLFGFVNADLLIEGLEYHNKARIMINFLVAFLANTLENFLNKSSTKLPIPSFYDYTCSSMLTYLFTRFFTVRELLLIPSNSIGEKNNPSLDGFISGENTDIFQDIERQARLEPVPQGDASLRQDVTIKRTSTAENLIKDASLIRSLVKIREGMQQRFLLFSNQGLEKSPLFMQCKERAEIYTLVAYRKG